MYEALLFLGFSIYFLIIFIETRKNKYFSPFILVATVYFLYFIFKAFVFYLNTDEVEEYFRLHNIDIEHIQQALFMLSLSFISFYLGYKVTKPNKQNKKYNIGFSFENTNPKKLFQINFILFFIWFAFNIYKFTIGLTHYAGAYSVAEKYAFGLPYLLSIVISIFGYSFYFLMYLYFKYKIYKKLFYISLILKISFMLIGGGALPMISLVLSYLLIYFWANAWNIQYKKPQINLLKLSLFGFLGLGLLIFIYLFKTISREFIKLGIQPLDILFNIDYTYLSIVFSHIDFSYLILSLFNRFMGVDAIANIMNSIDLGYIDYSYGYMFYLLAVGIIPKFILHDKPEVSMGMWYTETLWNRDNLATGYQNTALFIPGDLYLNFGYIGVIFGMFIYGLLLGYIFKIWFNNKNYIFSYVFVSTVFIYFLVSEYSFASWILTFVRVFLLLSVYSILIKILSKITFKGFKKCN